MKLHVQQCQVIEKFLKHYQYIFSQSCKTRFHNIFLVRGGLTLREGLEIAEAACKTKRVGVVDLVEVNKARFIDTHTKC